MAEFRLDNLLQRNNFRLDESLLKNLWTQKSLPQDCRFKISFTIVLFDYVELPSHFDVKSSIDLAVRSLHGLIGASQEYELTSYNVNTQTGVLLFRPQAFKKLWSSVTLIKEINAVKCIFAINDLNLITAESSVLSQLIVT